MKTLNRDEAYRIVDTEREHQDSKWPQNPPLPPSDELRLVRVILDGADKDWYVKKNEKMGSVRGSPSDMEAMRKIAAVCIRAIENYGAEPRR